MDEAIDPLANRILHSVLRVVFDLLLHLQNLTLLQREVNCKDHRVHVVFAIFQSESPPILNHILLVVLFDVGVHSQESSRTHTNTLPNLLELFTILSTVDVNYIWHIFESSHEEGKQ